MPPELLGASRRNSLGLDLAVAEARAPLLAALTTEAVPQVPVADAAWASAAVGRAVAAGGAWRQVPVAQRAAVLVTQATAARLYIGANSNSGRETPMPSNRSIMLNRRRLLAGAAAAARAWDEYCERRRIPYVVLDTGQSIILRE